MTDLPFQLTCRKDKGGVWYVRLKTADGYTPRKSTGTTDKREAIRIALDWYKNGITSLKKDATDARHADILALIDKIKRTPLDLQDATDILEALKKKRLLLSYTTASDCTLDAFDFLIDFWGDNSEYIKERTRKGRPLTKNYRKIKIQTIQKYWQPFKGKLLAALTKKDILAVMDTLDKTKLSNDRKSGVVMAALTPLSWAYKNDILDKDITKGVTLYAPNKTERHILTPEIASALFAMEWKNPVAKLANLLAMCTGMRSGEIRALQLQDLGANCIYVRHSYNPTDHLKSTKNGEVRTAYLPFPELIDALKALGETNPFNTGLDAYIFYNSVNGEPMHDMLFLCNLHKQLKQLGVADYQKYTFHAWRHYFATYLKDKIGDKVLQQQTGHKTLAMLEHYADHKTQEDIDRLESAQKSIFGDIVKSAL